MEQVLEDLNVLDDHGIVRDPLEPDPAVDGRALLSRADCHVRGPLEIPPAGFVGFVDRSFVMS